MSGWGGDDVDFYRRLKKRKLRALIFQPESFHEQGQKMAGKNSEAPRLDTELIAGHQELARQPFFSGFRNTLLARIQRQSKRLALRWRYTQVEGRANLVQAELRASSSWRLQVARHSIELANILAVAYYQNTESVWELIHSKTFRDILEQHQLPPWSNRRERLELLSNLRDYRVRLHELANSMDVKLAVDPTFYNPDQSPSRRLL
jgi:hypothetical protein